MCLLQSITMEQDNKQQQKAESKNGKCNKTNGENDKTKHKEEEDEKNEESQPLMIAPKVSGSDEEQKSESTLSSKQQSPNSGSSSSASSSLNSPDACLGKETTLETATSNAQQIDAETSKNTTKEIAETTKTSSSSSSQQIVTPSSPDIQLGADVKRLHMRQPFKILTDIWGVLTSYHFRADLFTYLDAHLKDYLLRHFDIAPVREFIGNCAKRTAEEKTKWPELPPLTFEWPPPSQDISISLKESIAQAVFANWLYRKQHKDKCLIKGLETLYGEIWIEGYREKRLHPHVFPDVMGNFYKWSSDPLYIKIHTFATGSSENQKLFLSSSTVGDVSKYVTSYFDTCGTYKYDWSRYRQVASGLGERMPKNLFYLTDSPRKGEEARKAGLTVFIVAREGNKKYKPAVLDKFTVITTFDQFDFYEYV